MKNKLKILIFIISITIIILSGQSFAQGNVLLEAEKEQIQKGETVTISVKTNGLSPAALTIHLYYDVNKLEFLKGPENSNLVENRILYTWVNETGKNSRSEQNSIATFQFRAKEEGSAIFAIDGELYNEQGQELLAKWDNFSILIGDNNALEYEETISEELEKKQQLSTVPEDSAYLESMRLNLEGVVPEFEKTITEYYVIIPNTKENIEPIVKAEHPEAIIEIEGNKNLKQGQNTIKINVTSPDLKNKMTYKIFVTKTQTPELANTNLTTLAIENTELFPSFNTNYMNYYVAVPYSQETAYILAIPEDERAKVSIKSNNSLEIGKNFVTIEVIAADNITKRNYNIEIYRRNMQEDIQEQEKTYESQKLVNEIKQKQEEMKKGEIEQNNEEETKTEINKEEKRKKQILIGTLVILFVIILVILYLKKKSNYGKIQQSK